MTIHEKLEALHACPFTYESMRAQGKTLPQALTRAQKRMEKTVTIYPIAWLRLSKVFAQCGALGLPLNSWHEDVQSVFREMALAGILTIKEPEGFVHLAKRLPKGFKDQVKRYA